MQEQTVDSAGSVQHSSFRTRPKRKKKNQLPLGLAVVLAMVVIGIFLLFRSHRLALFWTFGCCFGFILQKSRFCFTASMRDPCITGSTSVTRAVLIAFAITTIGFTAIKYGAFINGQNIPGQGNVATISLSTAVGAVLFGIGMVIAGGCASGTLMRVGEGFVMQMLSLVFFLIGSLVGAGNMGWWYEHFIKDAPKIFLPDVFGWAGALFLQLAFIFVLYIAADKYEKKRMGNVE